MERRQTRGSLSLSGMRGLMTELFFYFFFVPLTIGHNPITASIGVFLYASLLGYGFREPIPDPVLPGFEPGTATMPSEHVGTALTGPQSFQRRVVMLV